MPRILILGASGSGTTTIGSGLAAALGISHIETDDLFWKPTDPPYTQFNNPEKLRQIIDAELVKKDKWVLTGSPCGWDDEAIMPILDLVVFLSVPTELRIDRIKKREAKRWGHRISQGGDLHQLHSNFLEWTKQYDAGNITGRNRPQHEQWLSQLSCNVLRFEGDLDVPETIKTIERHLGQL